MTRAGAAAFMEETTSLLGDVRWLETGSDRLGYYRMNGRAAGALDTVGQAGLASLGLAALPNAANRSVRNQGAIGSTGGQTARTILRANLPNIDLTGNTNNDGQHGHSTNSPALLQNAGNAGPDKRDGNAARAGLVTLDPNTNPHNHTFTAALGGSGTALTIPKRTIALFAAICLDPDALNTWFPLVGDVKHSWQVADHGLGWYRLDGRPVAALPPVAMANAQALGIAGNLPSDARILKMRGALLATGGGDTATILQAHLPAFNMPVVSSTSPNTHAHSVNNAAMYNGGGGPNGSQNKQNTNLKCPNEGPLSIQNDGEHVHAYSIPLGGQDAPLAITLPYISLASFIWLGV